MQIQLSDFLTRFHLRGIPLVVLAATLLVPTATRAVVINSLLPQPVTTNQEWYETSTGPTGATAIVDLSGLGGDLENNQPAGIGAVSLMTGFDNSDRAGAVIADDGTTFGDAATALSNIDFSYWYHKAFVGGGNAAAAPALKLALFAAGGTGDNFGQLIFEPANQGAGNPSTDLWQEVVIDENTGGGDGDSVGGWWWSGGFEQPSGGGGMPFRSLSEWVTIFNGSDPVDFPNAQLVGIEVSVGSFNQGLDTYFDDLSIDINDGSIAYSETFDFEPIVVAAVPEPSSLVLLGLGLLGLVRSRRCRRA